MRYRKNIEMESDLGHFLTRCICYVLILKKTIENKEFHLLTKICEYF